MVSHVCIPMAPRQCSIDEPVGNTRDAVIPERPYDALSDICTHTPLLTQLHPRAPRLPTQSSLHCSFYLHRHAEPPHPETNFRFLRLGSESQARLACPADTAPRSRNQHRYTLSTDKYGEL
ncbi:Protein of unknown function [Gryllus bimaculatus]|nr:Protein of unknown function [Gryllus bimaculatus]